MYRLLAVLLCALVTPGASFALEIKNIRPSHGPLGATRFEAKCLPGDVMFMTYDLEGLVTDKFGKASYVTILELLDAQQKAIFRKETPNDVLPQLGGTRMPGDLHVIMGPKQAPGNYSIKLTVHDKLNKDPNNSARAFEYKFVVVPETFGLVGVMAPAIGFPGGYHRTEFALVNFTLDKNKQVNADVTIRILDQAGIPVTTAVQMFFPRDLPADADFDKANYVPLAFPIYLNRVGRYHVEISANDRVGNKKAELRFPMTVIDINAFTGK